MPSREIFWNIPYGYIVYILAVNALSVAGYSIYQRYKLWHVGKEGDRPKDIGKWISVFISIRFEAKVWGFSKLDSLANG